MTSTVSGDGKRGRLLALDALRGVAAIAVLFHHSERELHCNFGFAYGYLAVDVFFLMSGFVIVHAYEPRMRAGLTAWRFLKLRLVRLYPMMALGGLIGIGAAWLHGTGGPSFALAGIGTLTMLPLIWSGPLLFPLNIVEWSIFFEIVTNLLHRLIFRWLNIAALAGILLASLAGMGIAGWRLHGLANGFSPFTFWGGFPRTFLSYFAGVLLYRTMARWGPHVPRLPLPLLLLGFLAVVWGEMLVAGRVPASAYLLVAVTLLFPAGLMLLARARVPRGMTGIAQALGDLSYPLYAVHMPLLLIVEPFIQPLPAAARAMWALVVIVAVSLFALLLDRYYDRVVRGWVQHRSIAPIAPTEMAAP